jgi:hypothetical protein
MRSTHIKPDEIISLLKHRRLLLLACFIKLKNHALCQTGTVKSSMKRGRDMEPQSSRRNSLWSQSYKIGKAIN